jgi:hypothetical protein
VVEHAALGIDGSFGGVEILGLVVAQGAATEGDNLAGLVCDRKGDAATEAIEETAATLIAGDQAGLD